MQNTGSQAEILGESKSKRQRHMTIENSIIKKGDDSYENRYSVSGKKNNSRKYRISRVGDSQKQHISAAGVPSTCPVSRRERISGIRQIP